tara:strand:+ start:1804 stop:2343 length:540 start_codon:yes stop_codon:yes gene_type:complete
MFEQLAFIDPVTATFLITTGAKAVGSLFGSDADDTRANINAAKEVSFAETRDTAQEYEIGQEKIADTTKRLLSAATSEGQTSLMKLATQSESINTDFASNELATASVDNTRANIYDSYSSSVDDIMKDSSSQITQLDLNTKKKLDSISMELDANISGAVAGPDSFIERFSGVSNYEVGY